MSAMWSTFKKGDLWQPSGVVFKGQAEELSGLCLKCLVFYHLSPKDTGELNKPSLYSLE